MPRPRSVHDVAAHRLCTGCGVCAYLAPQDVGMVDVPDEGRRPIPLRPVGPGAGAGAALDCCPGAGLAHDRARPAPGEIGELHAAWGPVRALWEGYAADPQIRYAGSSGGVATALAAFCLEREEMAGTLHIGPRADVPYLNEPRFSRSRDELLAAAGSRYAPASPCERLDLIESEPRPSVFIGKPCDVAAVRMARRVRPELDRRVGLTIAVFCAGTPSTAGTLEMLRRMGVTDPQRLESVHYRGQGWPGDARARTREDRAGWHRRLSYEQSWGEVLQRHRQWRCHLCADHTGEFADVSVGDPWYRPTGDDPGRSLVLARTERGVRLVQAAIAAGYLVLEPAAPGVLPASQPNLLRARGAVWGRIGTLRLAGLMAPRLRRMPMAAIWWRRLSVREKARSTVGTLRRVRQRGLRRPLELTAPHHPRQRAADPAVGPQQRATDPVGGREG